MSFPQRSLLPGGLSDETSPEPAECDSGTDLGVGYPMVDLKGDPNQTTRELPPRYLSIPTDPKVVMDHASQVPGTVERTSYSSMLSSAWLLEILCCLIAVVATIVSVILLRETNGKPLKSWWYDFTTNSLIELITAVAKLALMVPILNALGQLKWLWFKKEAHPLADFQLYDEASIGGYQTLRFLATGRIINKSPIAWLAVVVALSSVLTSFMNQEAIGVTRIPMPGDGTASVVRAKILSRQGPNGFNPEHGDQLSIQQAYLTAAYLGPNDILPGVEPICSSGNCTWPNYGSLGICAEVVNISATTNSTLLPHLREYLRDFISNNSYYIYFNQLANDTYYPAIVAHLQPSTEFKLASTETVFSQHVIAYANSPVNFESSPSDAEKLQFIGFSLYYCTKSFSTMVKDGISITTELSSTNSLFSSNNNSSLNSWWNDENNNDSPCSSDTSVILNGPPDLANDTYTIDWCTGTQMSWLFNNGVQGVLLQTPNFSVYDTAGQIASAIGLALFGEYNAASVYDSEAQFRNITLIIENIGQSLTTFLRKKSTTVLDASATVNGTVMIPQTIVRVHWKYLSLLGIQIVFTIIVLTYTIMATSRAQMQILKRQSLAAMCALSSDIKHDLGGTENLDLLNQNAKKVLVKFQSASIEGRGIPIFDVVR